MEIIFTKYAQEKFKYLKEHKCVVTREQVKKCITSPDRFNLDLDPPKLIAEKEFDKKRNLRVVYLVESDIMKVISFYPAEKDE